MGPLFLLFLGDVMCVFGGGGFGEGFREVERLFLRYINVLYLKINCSKYPKLAFLYYEDDFCFLQIYSSEYLVQIYSVAYLLEEKSGGSDLGYFLEMAK